MTITTNKDPGMKSSKNEKFFEGIILKIKFVSKEV